MLVVMLWIFMLSVFGKKPTGMASVMANEAARAQDGNHRSVACEL
jgi:hypothetical protein